MRNLILSVVLAAGALVLSSCNSVEKFDYTSAPGTMTRFREPGSATKSWSAATRSTPKYYTATSAAATPASRRCSRGTG